MTSNRNKNIDGMVAQRRELDRQIRAAKRAEAKAVKEALRFERQALGVWLAESVGAVTIEDVRMLRAALEFGQVRHLLHEALGAHTSDTVPSSVSPRAVISMTVSDAREAGMLVRAVSLGEPRTTGAERRLSYGVKTIASPASPSGPASSGVSGDMGGVAREAIVSARRVWGCEAGGVPTPVVTMINTKQVRSIQQAQGGR